MRLTLLTRTLATRVAWIVMVVTLLAGSSRLIAAEPVAGEVVFPWGRASPPAATAPQAAISPYQTLPKINRHQPLPVAIQELSQKSGYAYGWFGSNPAPNWGRHFGYSRNFTQWTSR